MNFSELNDGVIIETNGISILIFPEGTFNETTNPLKDCYDGAFRLAIETQTPIKPLIFIDTYDRMRYDDLMSMNPGRCRAVFLHTIPVEGSLIWGAGKINAYQAIKLALQTIGNVGVESIHTSKFKLFPNPSISELKIDFMASLFEVQVVDMKGNIIKKQVCQNTIDITSLEAGVYLLRFEHNQKIYQQKFIKQ